MKHATKDWKEKYFATLQALDDRERDWRRIENTLRKGLNRLAILSQDGHQSLERQLHKVRTLARGTDNDVALAAAVEALISNDSIESGSDLKSAAKSAIATLTELLPFDNRQQTSLHKACQRGDDQQALKQLIKEIGQLINSQNGANNKTLAETLLGILQSIEAPEIDGNSLDTFAEKIAATNSPNQWQIIFESLLDCVSNELHVLSENKKNLIRFISRLTDKLEGYEHIAQSSLASMKKVRESSATANGDLTNTLSGLADQVSKSEDLREIKRSVSDRISSALSNMDLFFSQEASIFEEVSHANQTLQQQLISTRAELDQLRSELSQSREKQLRDALTGIANRHAYNERVRLEVERYHRSGKPFCFALWDIDHFKSINDSYGHSAGDEILKSFAQQLQQSFRRTDFVGRIGGEEFAVLLPETSIEEGESLCNTIRQSLASRQFSYKGQTFNVTASIGLAVLNAEDDSETIYQRADNALYQAKDAGRNQCVSESSSRNAA
ncbi:MAG: diguanylate cyclase [Pseudomonadota bacterium]